VEIYSFLLTFLLRFSRLKEAGIGSSAHTRKLWARMVCVGVVGEI
jgi:hypothetical protein